MSSLALLLATRLVLAAGPLEANQPDVEAGMSAYEAQDYESAVRHFTAAAVARPSDGVVQYNLADALFKAGKHREAAEALQRAESLDRDGTLKARLHYNRGTMLAAQGNRDEAVAELRRALKADPNDAFARHNLEVLLKNLKSQSKPNSDGGTPDGGADAGHNDAGQHDGGSDAGRPDGGAGDAGHGDGGANDGGADAGRGDGGSGDAGQGSGDGGRGDGGQGDGGQGERNGPGSDGGQPEDSQANRRDAGLHVGDAGASAAEAEATATVDGGLTPKEAKQLLDSLKSNEKTRPMIFERTKTKKNDTHGKDW